jgi:2-polyprenyl-6-hydroxyphenyl methylase / 3-demethylubiquinone-9 3-methyltransferase
MSSRRKSHERSARYGSYPDFNGVVELASDVMATMQGETRFGMERRVDYTALREFTWNESNSGINMSPGINNQMYDDPAGQWWDENGPLHLLKAMVNPWRVPYFESALRGHFGDDLNTVRLLDIGCGGGVLAEEFARMGPLVTGIDISPESINVARAHAHSEGLSIDYRVGEAIPLDFEANCFEVISCCDVLEHIPDWEGAISEAGRVLVPSGLFLFDTISRTPESRSTFIFGLQEFPPTRLFPRDTHIWEMFITPEELTGAVEGQGMQVEDISGGAIARKPLATLLEVLRHKWGQISVAELGSRLALRHDPDLSLNYLGYARKTG